MTVGDRIKKAFSSANNDDHTHDYADNAALELMLIGHSWQDYMKGMGTPEERDANIQSILDNGGIHYSSTQTISY